MRKRHVTAQNKVRVMGKYSVFCLNSGPSNKQNNKVSGQHPQCYRNVKTIKPAFAVAAFLPNACTHHAHFMTALRQELLLTPRYAQLWGVHLPAESAASSRPSEPSPAQRCRVCSVPQISMAGNFVSMLSKFSNVPCESLDRNWELDSFSEGLPVHKKMSLLNAWDCP